MPCLLRSAIAGFMVLSMIGCASNRYCLGEQEYQKAESLPPIKPVDGLKLPESPSALRIPPPPEKTVPFGVENDKGDGVCLDKPPYMPARKAATSN